MPLTLEDPKGSFPCTAQGVQPAGINQGGNEDSCLPLHTVASPTSYPQSGSRKWGGGGNWPISHGNHVKISRIAFISQLEILCLFLKTPGQFRRVDSSTYLWSLVAEYRLCFTDCFSSCMVFIGFITFLF